MQNWFIPESRHRNLFTKLIGFYRIGVTNFPSKVQIINSFKY